MKYRSRTEIIATILRIASKGTIKTKIMYGAYLSYTQMQEYIGFLEKKGLMERNEGTMGYTLTEKGLQYLHAYEKLENLMDGEVPLGGDARVQKLVDAQLEA